MQRSLRASAAGCLELGVQAASEATQGRLLTIEQAGMPPEQFAALHPLVRIVPRKVKCTGASLPGEVRS